jgi:glycosyltransferase involved in cell wall biosynthesis
MEAMSAGLPIVSSSIRGNTDLIEHGKSGYLLEPDDVEGFAASIEKLINNSELRKSMATRNIEEVKKYDKEVVKEEMEGIYYNM